MAGLASWLRDSTSHESDVAGSVWLKLQLRRPMGARRRRAFFGVAPVVDRGIRAEIDAGTAVGFRIIVLAHVGIFVERVMYPEATDRSRYCNNLVVIW